MRTLGGLRGALRGSALNRAHAITRVPSPAFLQHIRSPNSVTSRHATTSKTDEPASPPSPPVPVLPPAAPAPWGAVATSAVGAFLGMSLLSLLHKHIGTDSTLVLAGFGSSAVLLFSAPQLPFSQPKNVILGHGLSCLVGVLAHEVFPTQNELSVPAAVSLSLALSLRVGCVHPPAGGTAMFAAMGQSGVTPDIWLVVPSVSGATILVASAYAFNNLVPSRVAAGGYPKKPW